MSLDVYLTLSRSRRFIQLEPIPEEPINSRIFIREDGQTKEITRAEWGERFPGREPVTMEAGPDDSGEVYSANITHNLNKMAGAAGIYEYLWRPEEVGITKAAQLIEPLRVGLVTLKSDPIRFQQFNPPNGWGTYFILVTFVEQYLSACEKYPEAKVSVWR